MAVSFVVLVFICLVIELVYFRVADKYNIIDKPNARSSHVATTIRGGGMIFPIACLLTFPFVTYEHWIPFCISLIVISIISFLDDVMNLDSKMRLVIQSIAVITILLQFNLSMEPYQLAVVFIVFMGIINAYNFMDGINAITALYSIVTIASLFWVSTHLTVLMPNIFFLSLVAALLVFSFFNIRRKARCFAGDVGSVSMAFIICFLLFTLIIKTGSYIWILFLGLYGIDTVFTIICRITRKEPILQAHRSHFYQFLANEIKMSHVAVSIMYAGVQLLLNYIAIISYQVGLWTPAIVSLFAILLIYIIFRLRFEGRYRLFTAY